MSPHGTGRSNVPRCGRPADGRLTAGASGRGRRRRPNVTRHHPRRLTTTRRLSPFRHRVGCNTRSPAFGVAKKDESRLRTHPPTHTGRWRARAARPTRAGHAGPRSEVRDPRSGTLGGGGVRTPLFIFLATPDAVSPTRVGKVQHGWRRSGTRTADGRTDGRTADGGRTTDERREP